MRQALLLIPVALTLLVSGCTLPGGFCIPGITCGQTVSEADDVIVIESLQALPETVANDGFIKVVAVVSNVAGIDAEIPSVPDIQVELYDYCSGLFTLDSSTGGTPVGNGKEAQKISLLRGEKKQIEWNLKSLDRSKVPVKTECNLKVRAMYKYATKSITTLHLIDYTEMQRRISEGTYQEIGSYTSLGYGPVKPYIVVEGTQPIPVQDNKISAVLSLQIKNTGSGFLSAGPTPQSASGAGTTQATGPAISKSMLEIKGVDEFARQVEQELNSCIDKFFSSNPEGIKLIKSESTLIVCPISKELSAQAGNVPVESTKTIQASISDYWYEFRKEIKVSVEPKF